MVCKTLYFIHCGAGQGANRDPFNSCLLSLESQESKEFASNRKSRLKGKMVSFPAKVAHSNQRVIAWLIMRAHYASHSIPVNYNPRIPHKLCLTKVNYSFALLIIVSGLFKKHGWVSCIITRRHSMDQNSTTKVNNGHQPHFLKILCPKYLPPPLPLWPVNGLFDKHRWGCLAHCYLMDQCISKFSEQYYKG